MKKRIQKLPDSELDVMLALWNGHPDMTRLEVEDFVNQKRNWHLPPSYPCSPGLKTRILSL